MEYRIESKSSQYKDKVTTDFYIQKRTKFLLVFNIWVDADTYLYHTQEQAEAGVRFLCKCDAIIVPKNEIVKHMNCNE